MVTPLPLLEIDMVSIKSCFSTFLTAQADGTVHFTRSSRERFKVQVDTDGLFTFQSEHGNFLTTSGSDDNKSFSCTSTKVGPREKFAIRRVPESSGGVNIETFDSLIMSVTPFSGELQTRKRGIGTWETVWLINEKKPRTWMEKAHALAYVRLVGPVGSAIDAAREFEAKKFVKMTHKRATEVLEDLVEVAKTAADNTKEAALDTIRDTMMSKYDSYVERKKKFYLDDPDLPRCLRGSSVIALSQPCPRPTPTRPQDWLVMYGSSWRCI